MRRARRAALLAAVVMAACAEKREAPHDAGGPAVPSASTPASTSPHDPSPPAPPPTSTGAPPTSPAASTAKSTPLVDAGPLPPPCKLLGTYVPSFHGPAALRVTSRPEGDAVQLVFNEMGTPRVVVPALTLNDAGVASSETPPPKSPVPACAIAGEATYCPDATGAIHRGDRITARGRSGTDIVAAMLGERVLLAYLAERVTTEGLVREAYVTMDDGAPLRLSEEGSGATYVDLAVRGDAVVALIIDARVAMTPTHARVLRLKDGKLDIGKDAVIMVGGSAERHNAGALASSKEGSAFALVPVADDVSHFGMAAIRIDDPPKDDSPVVWSLYPNGLDPAPIAATRGVAKMYVARVRPSAADAKASRVLEVGLLEPSGAFRARCLARDASFVKDVELAGDRDESLWLFYRDPHGSRLERRAMPAEK